MSVLEPVYRVEIWSGSTLRHAFGLNTAKYISSLKVKPGMTATIGSFEISIPDVDIISNNPGLYKDVQVFDDSYIWLGYNNTGSLALLKGKIETIKSELDPNKGWVRTFIGRDYGECLQRIIGRERFSLDCGTIVINLRNKCTGSIYGELSTDNTYIESESTTGSLVRDNNSCFKDLKEISDFIDRDFYVDINKKLHWFTRQSTTGSDIFSTGSNILDYSITKDISNISNDIYVFGMRDTSGISGSDWPVGHISWTESTTNWTGSIQSGSNPEQPITIELKADITPPTGSNYIRGYGVIGANSPVILKFRYIIPNSPIRLFSDDFLHLWYAYNYTYQAYDARNIRIRLETTTNDYFETLLENKHILNPLAQWVEHSLSIGPRYEGVSITGSADSVTGSYLWTRSGNPDWYNISSVCILASGSSTVADGFFGYFNGLYFGTRFQYYTSSTTSQTAYGFRPYVHHDEKLNSNEYCQNTAGTFLATYKDSITQIEITTTGSPTLALGNRYKISIGSENIDSYYELIDLEHRFESNQFISKCLFTDKKEIRTPVPIINYPVQQVVHQMDLWDALSQWATKRSRGKGPQ